MTRDTNDALVVKHLTQQFLKTHKGLTLSERAVRRLYAAAERAKRQLSSATVAEIEVESLADGQDLKQTLTLAKFESLNQTLFESCLNTVRRHTPAAARGLRSHAPMAAPACVQLVRRPARRRNRARRRRRGCA